MALGVFDKKLNAPYFILLLFAPDVPRGNSLGLEHEDAVHGGGASVISVAQELCGCWVIDKVEYLV